MESKTEKELRDEFEKWAKEVNVSRYNEVYFVIFKSGYVLAQETIEKQKKENEKQLKAISEARELIKVLSSTYAGFDQRAIKAKAWLEENK